LIRDYTLQKKEIETKDGLVYLGDFVWDVKVRVYRKRYSKTESYIYLGEN